MSTEQGWLCPLLLFLFLLLLIDAMWLLTVSWQIPGNYCLLALIKGMQDALPCVAWLPVAQGLSISLTPHNHQLHMKDSRRTTSSSPAFFQTACPGNHYTCWSFWSTVSFFLKVKCTKLFFLLGTWFEGGLSVAILTGTSNPLKAAGFTEKTRGKWHFITFGSLDRVWLVGLLGSDCLGFKVPWFHASFW